MIVSIYLLYTVLWFIQTVFLHVLNMLFGLMTIRLNKCYCYCYTVLRVGIILLCLFLQCGWWQTIDWQWVYRWTFSRWLSTHCNQCLCCGFLATYGWCLFLSCTVVRTSAYDRQIFPGLRHDVQLMGDLIGVNRLLYITQHGQLSHSSSWGW